jgi:8-oxo-dGTP diphosphatase
MKNHSNATTSMKTIDVVAAIIMCSQKVLLAKRKIGQTYAGFWEFPGGKVEKGESDKAALIRECHEELAIHVVDCELYEQITLNRPYQTINLRFFKILHFTETPIGNEKQQIEWIPLHQLHEKKCLEANRPIIVSLQSQYTVK